MLVRAGDVALLETGIFLDRRHCHRSIRWNAAAGSSVIHAVKAAGPFALKRRHLLRRFLRNTCLGLLVGAILGFVLGIIMARIRVPYANPHNYAGLDRLVIGLSTMLIATSVGGVA